MSADGAKSYLAPSDYYSEGQELVEQWGGRTAETLGLRSEVDKPSFDLLCENVDPRSHERLTALTRDGRRVGYEVTWSAPKSVSVVRALTATLVLKLIKSLI